MLPPIQGKIMRTIALLFALFCTPAIAQCGSGLFGGMLSGMMTSGPAAACGSSASSASYAYGPSLYSSSQCGSGASMFSSGDCGSGSQSMSYAPSYAPSYTSAPRVVYVQRPAARVVYVQRPAAERVVYVTPSSTSTRYVSTTSDPVCPHCGK